MDLRRMARAPVRELRRPMHGGRAWKLERVEDYSHNLNPFGPPEDILFTIQDAVEGLEHYPDDTSFGLRSALAESRGLSPDNVIVGAGSSELIRLFPETFITTGDPVIIPRPSFSEYAFQVQLMGGRVKDMMLMEGEDFRIDVSRMVGMMGNYTKALYLCNPNNPTGRVEPRAKVLEIVEECARKGTLVMLDETLLELVPGYRDLTCVGEVESHPNLFIIGSFTKTYAIPGMRVGFGYGSKEMIAMLDATRLSWNVGHLEQVLATHLVNGCDGYIRDAVTTIQEERTWMTRRLSDIGFPVAGEPDSFFFFESLKKLDVGSREFQRMMLRENVMVRDCSSFGRPFDRYVRFCVKDRERNEGFISAMKAVVSLLR